MHVSASSLTQSKVILEFIFPGILKMCVKEWVYGSKTSPVGSDRLPGLSDDIAVRLMAHELVQ